MSETDAKILFDSRPTVTRACSRCKGHGSVIEPYFLRFSEAPIPGIPDDVIPALVVGTASIFETCREASDIAGRGQRTVAFEFINTIVSVKPGDDPDRVARLWWMNIYGETPEQTAARR